MVAAAQIRSVGRKDRQQPNKHAIDGKTEVRDAVHWLRCLPASRSSTLLAGPLDRCRTDLSFFAPGQPVRFVENSQPVLCRETGHFTFLTRPASPPPPPCHRCRYLAARQSCMLHIYTCGVPRRGCRRVTYPSCHRQGSRGQTRPRAGRLTFLVLRHERPETDKRRTGRGLAGPRPALCHIRGACSSG